VDERTVRLVLAVAALVLGTVDVIRSREGNWTSVAVTLLAAALVIYWWDETAS
jgi:hypothetical protein